MISFSIKSVESGKNAMGDCASCTVSSRPTVNCVPLRYSNQSKEGLFKKYSLLLCIQHKQELVKQKSSPMSQALAIWVMVTN